jgi:hypothetical protein
MRPTVRSPTIQIGSLEAGLLVWGGGGREGETINVDTEGDNIILKGQCNGILKFYVLVSPES